MVQYAYHKIELKLSALLCGYHISFALVFEPLFCITFTLHFSLMLERFLTFVISNLVKSIMASNGLMNVSHGKVTPRDDLLSLYLISSLLRHTSWTVHKYYRAPVHWSLKILVEPVHIH